MKFKIHILLLKKWRLSARTDVQQSDLQQYNSVANDSVGKMYTCFPNAINVCLHPKPLLLSFIKSFHLTALREMEMVQYWRALMKHDISISARVTKWFMSCDVPLYGILKPGLPGANTCSAHVCSSSNCRLGQHIASLPPSLPPQSWQTWKGCLG